jgi:hypothetical protein
MVQLGNQSHYLQATRDVIALAMGSDVRHTPPDMRALSNATLAITASLMKALLDNGVLTMDQVQAATDAALGADGTAWDAELATDDVLHLSSLDTFPTEGFEDGAAGADVDETNSGFFEGQVTDLTAVGAVSATFDATQHVPGLTGSQSMKVVTNDGASIAVRTGVNYEYTSKLYLRFYFRATVAPATSGNLIFAAQLNTFQGGVNHYYQSVDAERWCFAIGVDTSGHPVMYNQSVAQAPGSTPPNICDGNWWRIEAAFFLDETCELRIYGGADLLTTTITFSWSGTYTGGLVNTFILGQPKSTLASGQSWTTWYDKLDAGTSASWFGP